jgi:hypothetical protein
LILSKTVAGSYEAGMNMHNVLSGDNGHGDHGWVEERTQWEVCVYYCFLKERLVVVLCIFQIEGLKKKKMIKLLESS